MSSRVCSVFMKLVVLAIFVITAGATGCSSNGSGGTRLTTGGTTGTAVGMGGRGMTGGTTGGAAGTVISAASAGGQLAAAPDAGGAGGSDGAAASLPDAPIATGGSGGSTGMGGGGAVADAAADQSATVSPPDAAPVGGIDGSVGTGGVGGREAGGEGGSSGIAGTGGTAGVGGGAGGSGIDAGADRGADVPAVSDGVPPASGVDGGTGDTGVDGGVGPVAYYPFNGNANDESGNGHNGTVYGATLATDRFGQANRSYSFAGGSNRIVVSGAKSSFGFSDVFSVVAWFATSASVGAIVTKWQGSVTGDWFLSFQADNPEKIDFEVKNGTTNWGQALSTVKYDDGKWHMAVAVFSMGTCALYMDGSWSTISNSPAFVNNDIDQITIGNESSTSWGFTGNIDDVRIYDRALSDQEILDLYHEGGWTGP